MRYAMLAGGLALLLAALYGVSRLMRDSGE